MRACAPVLARARGLFARAHDSVQSYTLDSVQSYTQDTVQSYTLNIVQSYTLDSAQNYTLCRICLRSVSWSIFLRRGLSGLSF